MLRILFSGAVFNIINIVIQTTLGMLVFREMFLSFGENDFGQWTFIFSILTQITLFEFGLGSIVSKLTPIIQKKEVNRQRFSTALFAIFLIGIVFLIIITVSAFFFNYFPPSLNFEADVTFSSLLFLLGLNFIFTFQGMAAQAYLNGKFKLGTLNLIKILITIIRSIGILLGLHLGLGVFFVAIMFAITSALQLLSLIGFSVKIGMLSDIGTASYTRESWHYIRAVGGRFMFMNINNYLRNNAAIIFCGVLLGAVAIIPLRIAGRLIEIYAQVTSSLVSMLTPHFSSLLEEKEGALQSTFRISMYASSAFASLIFINICFLGFWFIKTWLGEVPENSYEILVILGAGFMVANSQGPCTPIMISKDRISDIMRLSLIESVIACALMYPLVLLYEVKGSAYAVTIALLVSRGIVQPVLIARLVNISLLSYTKISVIPVLFVSTYVFVLHTISTLISEVDSFPQVFVFCLLQLLSIALFFLFCYFKFGDKKLARL